MNLARCDDRLPDGEPVECLNMPALGRAHIGRLRHLWSLGRPAHLSELGGVELDLVVHGLLATQPEKAYSGPVVTVTKRGVAHLNEARQATVSAQRPHHALGGRLAQYLRAKGMHTWENVEFSNPRSTADRRWGVVRPDVFACVPSLKARNASPAIYEVKVSRADFLADLANPIKREAYSDLAEAVYYCCPDGLVDATEVPVGYGLLCETAAGVYALRKKARRQKGFALAADTAMTLMVKRQVPLGEL